MIIVKSNYNHYHLNKTLDNRDYTIYIVFEINLVLL